MIRHYKRALADILNNCFLNAVTIITIAMSVLIVSAFYLFFFNAGEVMNAWKKGIRIMAYLKPGIGEESQMEMENRIRGMYGVQDVRFISKVVALEGLKKEMKRQASLFRDLKENPLPDAFEIRMISSSLSMEKIEEAAVRMESIEGVEDVEYGEKWLGRFSGIFDLFKFVGYGLGSLFFMAAVFIVANTIRLVLYSRREEIEIMRLVGATDGFIKAPFYFEGLILGALGSFLGLSALFIAFLLVSTNVQQGFAGNFFEIRFLSFSVLGLIMACGMSVGWLGSYLSLRQFLKD